MIAPVCLSALFAERNTMKVLAFTGYSGSGKTTLLEKLITRLSADGVDLAVIKHTHHDIDPDTPGRDSWRHRQAGARQVMLAAARRRVLIEELSAANDLPLLEHLAALQPCQLVLVEGFKHERGLAKIEVFDPALSRPALYLTDPDVLAVACDMPLPDCPLPRFSRHDVEGILQLIHKSVLS